MYGINYDGLRKRKSYEQLLFDIENQPMIKYPNRAAKFLRNSQIISNLLDGDIADLTENENRRKLLSIGLKIEKNKIREHFIGSEIDIDGYESADSVDEELVEISCCCSTNILLLFLSFFLYRRFINVL